MSQEQGDWQQTLFGDSETGGPSREKKQGGGLLGGLVEAMNEPGKPEEKKDGEYGGYDPWGHRGEKPKGILEGLKAVVTEEKGQDESPWGGSRRYFGDEEEKKKGSGLLAMLGSATAAALSESGQPGERHSSLAQETRGVVGDALRQGVLGGVQGIIDALTSPSEPRPPQERGEGWINKAGRWSREVKEKVGQMRQKRQAEDGFEEPQEGPTQEQASEFEEGFPDFGTDGQVSGRRRIVVEQPEEPGTARRVAGLLGKAALTVAATALVSGSNLASMAARRIVLKRAERKMLPSGDKAIDGEYREV